MSLGSAFLLGSTSTTFITSAVCLSICVWSCIYGIGIHVYDLRKWSREFSYINFVQFPWSCMQLLVKHVHMHMYTHVYYDGFWSHLLIFPCLPGSYTKDCARILVEVEELVPPPFLSPSPSSMANWPHMHTQETKWFNAGVCVCLCGYVQYSLITWTDMQLANEMRVPISSQVQVIHILVKASWWMLNRIHSAMLLQDTY